MGIVRHTDAERDWAYDRQSIGRLDQALDEATQKGRTVVDMKQEWSEAVAHGAPRAEY